MQFTAILLINPAGFNKLHQVCSQLATIAKLQGQAFEVNHTQLTECSDSNCMGMAGANGACSTRLHVTIGNTDCTKKGWPHLIIIILVTHMCISSSYVYYYNIKRHLLYIARQQPPQLAKCVPQLARHYYKACPKQLEYSSKICDQSGCHLKLVQNHVWLRYVRKYLILCLNNMVVAIFKLLLKTTWWGTRLSWQGLCPSVPHLGYATVTTSYQLAIHKICTYKVDSYKLVTYIYL